MYARVYGVVVLGAIFGGIGIGIFIFEGKMKPSSPASPPPPTKLNK
jgi:hypothetical protein